MAVGSLFYAALSYERFIIIIAFVESDKPLFAKFVATKSCEIEHFKIKIGKIKLSDFCWLTFISK